MRKLIGDIDRLLRGGFTRSEDLAAGRIQVPVQTLIVMGTVLGMLYGAFMGLYGATRPAHATLQHVFANVVKVPLLFLLTLAVAFPSLYVFSALADSRLRLGETLRLLLAAIVVNLALLASFGPVTGFFTLSTDSYSFMVVLNVVFFGVAGFAGLGFLRKALNSVFAAPSRAAVVSEPEAGQPESGPLGKAGVVAPEHRTQRRPELARDANPLRIFTIWTVIYAVVGAQMAGSCAPSSARPTWSSPSSANAKAASSRACSRRWASCSAEPCWRPSMRCCGEPEPSPVGAAACPGAHWVWCWPRAVSCTG